MAQNDKPVYSSYIKDMPFLFLEMRKAAKLIVDGTDVDHIVSLSTKENIFQLDKERRRLKLAQKIVSRLSVLTKEQIAVLATEQESDAKLIAFYAIIKTDLLFFEFMRDVYFEMQNIEQMSISDQDITLFLHGKEEISKWTDNNFVRVKNTYKSILCEAGLAIRNGAGLKIQTPILDEAINMAFPQTDEYTVAMSLGVYYENIE